MSDAEQRLTLALGALRPPEHDPSFRIAVLERRALRQMRVRLVGVAGAGLGLTATAILARPTLEAALGPLAVIAGQPTVLIAGSLLVSAWSLWQSRRPI